MSRKGRVGLLRVLVRNHPTLKQSSRIGDIADEIDRIAKAGRYSPNSRWLLSVLHTTRAMDTTLSEVLVLKGWAPKNKSLGSYLYKFKDKGILTSSQRLSYQSKVVDQRNIYMHQAGAIPNKLAADAILAEMEACVTHVLGQVLSVLHP